MNIRHLIACMLFFYMYGCTSYHHSDKRLQTTPAIYPDYSAVTFPPNIAPPNFIIRKEADAYQTEIGIKDEPGEILIHHTEPLVRIPEKKWRTLMKKAAGKEIYFRISLDKNNEWTEYTAIENKISIHPIDPYLVYRLLYPGYELWNEMGIYQRNLTNYKQTPVAENRDFGKQCINCHTFHQNSPDKMMMHVRGKQGGTLIYREGQVKKVNPNLPGHKYGATYPAWHPSGRYIAFSANEIQQFFHASGQKPIEVADLGADLVIYDVEKHQTYTDSLVCGNQYMETFPTWSPDGKTLYFCRAQGYRQGMPLDSLRYDLCRVQFDAENQKLHTLECVYQASASGHSVSFPRVSPNGEWLMFTQSDYGNFSIWHPESDLYLLNLTNGKVRNINEVNSENVESFHTWSSTGHWFVFSSKRLDGLWARPYFAAFDPETGEASKPFLLPQKDPRFYDTFTYTFNLPELIKAPIKNGRKFVKTIVQP